MSKRLVTDDQANALAEMYTWEAVISILEGSCAPRTRTGQTAADRVTKIAYAQQKKLIRVYDKDKDKDKESRDAQ
jgi:hypothetical protein